MLLGNKRQLKMATEDGQVRRTISFAILVPVVFVAGYQYAYLKPSIDFGNPWLSLALFVALVVGVGLFAASFRMVYGDKKGASIAWYVVGLAVVVFAILLGQQVLSAIGWGGLFIVLGAVIFVVGFWVLTTWGPFSRMKALRTRTASSSGSSYYPPVS